MSDAENAPLTIEQAVAELGKSPAPNDAPDPAAPANDDAPDDPDADNAAAEGADAEAEAAADDADTDAEEGEAEEEEELPQVVPDPPQSWSKEDREGWEELTPKAREIVLRRAKENDAAIAQFAQKTSEAVKFVQSLAARTEELAGQITTDFDKKWEWCKGDPDSPAWAKLAQAARDYPDQYDFNLTRAQFDAERGAIAKAQATAKEQSELAQRTFLAEEGQKLTTVEPELVDPKQGEARRKKTFEHLADRGFPRELFPNISALELSVAYDAMRWRESQTAAKAAAAQPRKNATAPVAKVVRPSSASASSPQRSLQGAMTALAKTGSIDNAVAALQAQRAANAKKGARQ